MTYHINTPGYAILCEVHSDDGYRCAYLKEHGIERKFRTYELAVAECDRLNAEMNNGPHKSSTHRFNYVAVTTFLEHLRLEHPTISRQYSKPAEQTIGYKNGGGK